MVASERVYYASRSRAPLGRDPRLRLGRRRPRRHPARNWILSGVLALMLAPFGATTLPFQDVAEFVGADVPLAQRWLAHVTPVPSGEVFVPGSDKAAVSEGVLIEPKLGLTRPGPASAPLFEPPAVNRTAKADISVPLAPPKVAYVRFNAGSVGARPAALAFAAPEPMPATTLVPRDDAKPAAGTLVDKRKVASPNVQLASIAPMEKGRKTRGGKGAKGGDADPVSAYANTDDTSAMEAPFRALLGGPSRIGADGKPDHWWVMNPIPKNARSKTEQKCLATAIYFEARGEPEKGQLAVAQVVINRLKNPAYPNTVCGVVYQNKNMRNACQFSFACDGIKDRITDMGSWRQAEELAHRVLFDDNWWNAKVGSSTHYHANYVRPRWARTMKKMQKIGHHIFYKTYGGGWS